MTGCLFNGCNPIIPTSRKEPFDDPDWLFDLKYDGFRAVSYFERGSCRFVSRRGNVFTRSTRCAGQVASALCEKRRSRARKSYELQIC